MDSVTTMEVVYRKVAASSVSSTGTAEARFGQSTATSSRAPTTRTPNTPPTTVMSARCARSVCPRTAA